MFEIEFKLDKSAADAPRGKHYNFKDPGPFPENLTYAPGFLSALTDWTVTHCHSPNRVLAFSGALAVLSHLSARFYTDRAGTRTNLYIIALAPSGAGKDAPRTTNNRLLDRLKISHTLMENIPSGEGLEDALYKTPSLLLQSDEVDCFFGQMRGYGRLAKGLSSRLRSLFTTSGGKYNVRKKANDNSPVKTIVNPHLTVFGTGVDDELLNGLTPHEIKNGLFGRCLIFAAQDENIRTTPNVFEGFPPPIVLKYGEYMAMRESKVKPGKDPFLWLTLETDEALEAKQKAKEFFAEQRKILAAADLRYAEAVVARIDEKISKLALLYAISKDAFNPIIDIKAVKWATRFSAYVIRWMLYQAQFHIAEGRFGKLMERMKAAISKLGGSATRRDLIRALHCDEATLNRLVRALLVAEEIAEPELFNGKIIYRLYR